MKAVVQRVTKAQVCVEGRSTGSIETGLFVMVGLHVDDDAQDLDWLVGKVARLRVFEDDEGRMNRSVGDMGGSLLVVSEFTLYGDARKGNRPSYAKAMSVEQARAFWPRVEHAFQATGIPCAFGEFQTMMDCHLVNDGPVTLILDSSPGKLPRS
ncbi:MAG: D-tyrosyl-tRNA(Tyr) deacylase [Deltaproteobacteria bacterium]|nr:D-tyrosyl-tRNA(Tyr) deacylase [Deltaproteobacteria bacterium]